MENCFWAEEHGSWLPPAEEYGCYHPATMAPPWDGDRTATASRSHSEAEKRRRDRINTQLATLRKLIPKSEKMDKAALLGHVVDHVKEESKKAKEVGKLCTIPTEIDEVIIDQYLNEEESPSASENMYMKASICCDDRPGFLSELNSALKGVGVTLVEADISSLGGRMKTSFVVCAKENNSCSNSLKNSLKLALSRIVISSGPSGYSARSKRQRFFYPDFR
ncbi:hypothetical protein ACS0TY_001033 [Phlomoides rotata]